MNPYAAEFFGFLQGSFSVRVGVEIPPTPIMVVMNLSARGPQAEGPHTLHTHPPHPHHIHSSDQDAHSNHGGVDHSHGYGTDAQHPHRHNANTDDAHGDDTDRDDAQGGDADGNQLRPAAAYRLGGHLRIL